MSEARTVTITPETAEDKRETALSMLNTEAALTESSERGFIDRIAAMEQAAAIFERRAQLLDACRMAAIKQTNPEDWIMHRARDGSTICMPNAAGCFKMADVYGIVIENVRPTDARGTFQPERIAEGGERYTLRAWGDGYSQATGRKIEDVEASRRSDEDFIGRDDTPSDLRAAVFTLVQSKIIRILTGTSKVPLHVLADAWQGTNKTTDRCVRGHGFGRASERGEASEAGVEAQAEALWKGCIELAEGDEKHAREILQQITSKPTSAKSKGFPGFTDHKRIRYQWQVDQAKPTLTRMLAKRASDDETNKQ